MGPERFTSASILLLFGFGGDMGDSEALCDYWRICEILKRYVMETSTEATLIPEGKSRNRMFCFGVHLYACSGLLFG